jgi:hypothetical protein
MGDGTFNGLVHTLEAEPLEGFTCMTCGHESVSYRITMLRFMVDFAEFVASSDEPTYLGDAMLSGTAYANAFRASNWGFIRSSEPDGKQGPWLATDLGRAFLAGRIKAPLMAIYRERQVLKYEGPLISCYEVPTSMRQKPDVVREYFKEMKRRNIKIEKASERA